MPDEFDLSSHINNDGTFNSEGPGLAALAGEDHKDSKSYEDVKDFPSFVKASFDSHAMVGKKLENVIQKPGENATDQEKADYRKALNAERGAPKAGAEYEFTRVEGLPSDEAKEAEFREFCFKNEVPKDTAKAVWDWYHTGQKALFDGAREAETKAEGVKAEQLRTDWVGDKMIENPRMVYNLLQAMGSELYPDFWDDFKGPDGEMIKGCKTTLKELSVYDSPGDLEKWEKAGIGADQLRFLEVFARKMKIGSLLTGDGTGGNIGDSQDESAAKKMVNAVNAGSPGFKV